MPSEILELLERGFVAVFQLLQLLERFEVHVAQIVDLAAEFLDLVLHFLPLLLLFVGRRVFQFGQFDPVIFPESIGERVPLQPNLIRLELFGMDFLVQA